MQIQLLSPRATIALMLCAVLLGSAPAAAQKLETIVGNPIAYRVGLPAGAEIVDDGETVHVETENAIVFVGAVDLVATQDEKLPISDREARRLMTNVFMDSDSLLLGLLYQSMAQQGVELENIVTEMRTLGGQRAGYLRGEFVEAGDRARMEMHVTVKDGIMYLLIVGCEDGDDAASATLAQRIHQSFVLADAPPAGIQAPARRSGVLRRTQRSR
jgi:hypothetical protein